MTIKLKYSDEPIEVTGMCFDKEGTFFGFLKEGDPAAPVNLDEFYPKEDCAVLADGLTPQDISTILNIDMDYQNEMSISGKIPPHEEQMKEILRRFQELKARLDK